MGFLDENLNLLVDLRVTEEVARIVRKPRGMLYRSLDPHIFKGVNVVAVGDFVGSSFVLAGLRPAVIIGDGFVERMPYPLKPPEGYRVLSTENPPGCITVKAWHAVKSAIESSIDGVRVFVLVDGEEDLLGFPAVILAPDGWVMVYGQPGEGFVAVRVTSERRREAVYLLSLFKPLR